jgi:leucyl aminopeptidase
MYFTDDDELGERIYRKGLEVKDPVWRMPLYEGYEKRLKGKIR